MAALSEKSRVTVQVGTVIVLAITVFKLGSAWTGLLRDIRDEIGGLRQEVRSISEDRWTTQDMERWSAKLEKSNRQIPLNVPEPIQTITERK